MAHAIPRIYKRDLPIIGHAEKAVLTFAFAFNTLFLSMRQTLVCLINEGRPRRYPLSMELRARLTLRRLAQNYQNAMRAARQNLDRLEKASASVHFQGKDFAVFPSTRLSDLRMRLKCYARQHNGGRRVSSRVARTIENILKQQKLMRLLLWHAREDWERAEEQIDRTYFVYRQFARRTNAP